MSALERCIVTLTDPAFDPARTYVPYRDSPLTMLLQSSLGGSSRTTMLVTCATDAGHIDETLSTLRFGVRAACVTNGVTREKEETGKELVEKLLQLNERMRVAAAGPQSVAKQRLWQDLAKQRASLLLRARTVIAELKHLPATDQDLTEFLVAVARSKGWHT